MEQQPAPLSVLEFVVCDCKKKKCGENCQCRVLIMECTDLCKCNGDCDNVVYNDDTDTEESDTEENDDDDGNDDVFL